MVEELSPKVADLINDIKEVVNGEPLVDVHAAFCTLYAAIIVELAPDRDAAMGFCQHVATDLMDTVSENWQRNRVQTQSGEVH